MKAENKYKLATALCRTVLFWVYCVLGALVFMAIEGNDSGSHEERESLYRQIKKNLTAKYGINETVFDELTRELEKASRSLYSDRRGWSFGDSLLFVESIVTTIGYGHITPVTIFGRMFCIIYAIFGIPICLAMLAIVGDVLCMVHMTWIQKLEKRYPLSLSCDVKCAIICGIQTVVLIFIGAGIHMKVDNWTLDEGIYAWFITFTTIGFGDLIPGYHYAEGEFGIHHGVLAYRIFFDIFGLCVVAALLVSLSKILQRCRFHKYCFILASATEYDEFGGTRSNNAMRSSPMDEDPESL